MAQRTCSVDGCDRKHRARGLCSSHYNQSRYTPERRHRKRAVACAGCGKTVHKYQAGSRKPVCSNECRYLVQYGHPKPARPAKCLVGPIDAPKIRPSASDSVPSTRRGFISGFCAWCGDSFVQDMRVTGVAARHCSKKCAARASRYRIRLARGRFDISPTVRLAIYERDNWTCQLCFEPIDRGAGHADDWAPSLDHIIPQSHQLIPDHSPDALRTAHRWCNAIRGDGTWHKDFFTVHADAMSV